MSINGMSMNIMRFRTTFNRLINGCGSQKSDDETLRKNTSTNPIRTNENLCLDHIEIILLPVGRCRFATISSTETNDSSKNDRTKSRHTYSKSMVLSEEERNFSYQSVQQDLV